jgi:hypothetical protein
MVTTTQKLDSRGSRGLKSAITFWRAMRLFFLMSFGAIFGIACIGFSPHRAIAGAMLGAMVGLVIHVYTGHILRVIVRILREW